VNVINIDRELRSRATGDLSPLRPLPLLLACLVVSPWLVAAQQPFGPGVEITDEDLGVMSSFAVDIDGDTDLDIVSTAAAGDTVAWHENVLGDASLWVRHLVDDVVNSAWQVHAADVDGDGDADILATGRLSNTVSWYENLEGDGQSWQRHVIRSIDVGPTALHAVDMDRDGDIDVISGAVGFDTVSWHENVNGDGRTWLTRLIWGGVADPQSAWAGDVDMDGDMDVVVAYSNASIIAYYENIDGGGNQWASRTVAGGMMFANSVTMGDLDGDGDLDFAATAANADVIVWFENIFVPFSWPAHLISGAFRAPAHVSVVDLDQDGDLDVLSASSNDDQVAFHENTDGTGQAWITRALTSTANEARSVGAGDLDGDGDLDVYAAALGDNAVKWFRNESIHRSAFFPFEDTLPLAQSAPGSLAAADMDRDGELDLVSASFQDDRVIYHRNIPWQQPPWSEETVASLPGPTAVAVGDLNGDARTDVLAASSDDGSIVWYGNFPGVWTPAQIIASDAVEASAVIAADIDGDGDLDAVTGSSGSSPLAWQENLSGDGSAWAEHALPTVRPQAQGLVAADLDGDGDLDLVAAFPEDDLIVVHQNLDGVGLSWGSHLAAAGATGVHSVAVGDLDRDGDLDLFSAAPGNDSVSWHENLDGLGTSWLEHLVSDDVAQADTVAVVDLDRDGDLDIVSSAPGVGRIVWQENLGLGFGWAQHSDLTAAQVEALLTVDLDDDGTFDLVSASPGEGTLSLYPNLGGQVRLVTENTAPAAPFEGLVDDLLRIRVDHLGRSGDEPLQITSLSLMQEDGDGNVVDPVQTGLLAQALLFYLDDGSGAFEPHRDTLLATSGVQESVSGMQSVAFLQGDPAVQVDPGFSKELFVVAEFASEAASVDPNSLRVIHAASAGALTQDPERLIPLQQEYSPDVASGTMIVGVDSDADGHSHLVDCDDEDARVFPDAIEVCDGLDNDCSGQQDDACTPASIPSVAVCDGTAHYVWAETSPSGTQIRHRNCAPGGACDDAGILAFTTTRSGAPSVACSGNTVVAVWEDRRGGTSDIAYRRSLDAGGSFQPLQFVVRGPGEETAPVVVLSAQRLLVAWEDTRLGNRDIALRGSSDAGDHWEDFRFLVRSPLDESQPALALDGALALVAWVDQRHGNGDVAYRRSTTSGLLWSPMSFLVRAPSEESHPSAVLDGSVALVGWVDRRAGNADLALRRSSDGGGGFDALNFLARSPGEDTDSAIRLDGADALVSWVDRRSGDQNISLRRSSNAGVGWEPVTRLVSAPTDEASPECDVNAGVAACVWADARSGVLVPYARHSLDSGKTWQPRFPVETD
jgi:hypothetical protein